MDNILQKYERLTILIPGESKYSDRIRQDGTEESLGTMG
jgi:hypothetical protein